MLELNKAQELYKLTIALDCAEKTIKALANIPASEYSKVAALISEAHHTSSIITEYRNKVVLAGITLRYYPGTFLINADDLQDYTVSFDGYRVRIMNIITNKEDTILCAPVDDGYPDNSKFSAMKQGQTWFANYLSAKGESKEVLVSASSPASIENFVEKTVDVLNECEITRLQKAGYINAAFFTDEGDLAESYKWNYKAKKKYINIDAGTSGAFMVEIETGEIFNIKGYGQIDKNKKLKANLGRIQEADPAVLYNKRYNYLR